MMFAVIALILFATFGLLDGLLRARIQRHRTGDTGIRIPPTTAQQWWARGTFAFGMLLGGIGAPVAELLGLPPIPLLDQVPIRVTGIALAATAVVASFAAQLAMGPSWRTTVDPDERPPLVTGGIFHVVRNPIYSALIMMVIGLILVAPNAIALAGLAMAITGSQLRVRLIEEPYLHRIHGTGYHEYASRVGRFVPGIGQLHPPTSRTADTTNGAHTCPVTGQAGATAVLVEDDDTLIGAIAVRDELRPDARDVVIANDVRAGRTKALQISTGSDRAVLAPAAVR